MPHGDNSLHLTPALESLLFLSCNKEIFPTLHEVKHSTQLFLVRNQRSEFKFSTILIYLILFTNAIKFY